MARKRHYAKAHRVNVILEEEIHSQAAERAEDLKLTGGFSEYVSRLIVADLARKSRAVVSVSRSSIKYAA